MGYLPIFLDLSGRRCVVVGGGEVSARKVEALLEAGAEVVVVSPHMVASLTTLAEHGKISHLARPYRRGDLQGCALAYAATNDDGVHREIANEARELGVALNVVDVPELCTFIAPAVMRQGALQIAVSTGGASPAFARRIRRELESQFGVEYALTLEVLGAARKWIRKSAMNQSERARRLTALASSPLPNALRDGDFAAVDRIIAMHLGSDVDLKRLGLAADALGLADKLDFSE
ncbi:MAG: siroheme synthase [Candidatus Binatus sp.]|nr:siroheme synthase [Candidatus Binatus sp.]